jgi:hypothetical protein
MLTRVSFVPHEYVLRYNVGQILCSMTTRRSGVRVLSSRTSVGRGIRLPYRCWQFH